ncbi:cupin domain-containing protein [Streptomyces sp. NPDC094049]|uniref:cupin domain-containing protein n=1 Tax=Streptomyces sp. NPDC094049 TaxID=3154987 RepID=UPI00331B36A6
MTGIVRRSFDAADESRPFEDGKGRLDLLTTERGPVGRALFEPGWKWSLHVKPIAGTESCLAGHAGYMVSGRLMVVMDDGESMEFGPGDYMEIAPGHDAWVVGDERVALVDWVGYGDYARPPSG